MTSFASYQVQALQIHIIPNTQTIVCVLGMCFFIALMYFCITQMDKSILICLRFRNHAVYVVSVHFEGGAVGEVVRQDKGGGEDL